MKGMEERCTCSLDVFFSSKIIFLSSLLYSTTTRSRCVAIVPGQDPDLRCYSNKIVTDLEENAGPDILHDVPLNNLI